MKTQMLSSKSETAKFIWPLLIAVVITLFLFYIDEGFYNFKWMLNIGNWIAFLLYVAAIYVVQLILILPVYRAAPEFILTSGKIIFVILVLLLLTFVVFL